MSSKIDPRGPRFGAAVTVVVLAAALVTLPGPLATGLLVLQATAHGLGAFAGLKAQPYGAIYRLAIAKRVGPPAYLEDSAPPQFAQLVGFIFAATALIGLSLGATTVAQVAVGLALAAAFLNAAFGICLGCEMYVIGKRLASR